MRMHENNRHLKAMNEELERTSAAERANLEHVHVREIELIEQEHRKEIGELEKRYCNMLDKQQQEATRQFNQLYAELIRLRADRGVSERGPEEQGGLPSPATPGTSLKRKREEEESYVRTKI